MALTNTPDRAETARRRVAAGLRTVRRAIVRRSDAWLYGLDQAYPEYDAYHRRTRRIARAVGLAVHAVERVAAVTIGLCDVLESRWARRPHSDKRPATPRPGPAGAIPNTGGPAGAIPGTGGPVGAIPGTGGGRTGGAHRAQLRDTYPASRTGLPAPSGSDVSDPPRPMVNRPPTAAESAPAGWAVSGGLATSASTPATRHTPAIPSTSVPGAA